MVAQEGAGVAFRPICDQAACGRRVDALASAASVLVRASIAMEENMACTAPIILLTRRKMKGKSCRPPREPLSGRGKAGTVGRRGRRKCVKQQAGAG